MPSGMFLNSEGRASSLSDPAGSYTLKAPCEQFGLSYGQYGVLVTNVHVDRCRKVTRRLPTPARRRATE